MQFLIKFWTIHSPLFTDVMVWYGSVIWCKIKFWIICLTPTWYALCKMFFYKILSSKTWGAPKTIMFLPRNAYIIKRVKPVMSNSRSFIRTELPYAYGYHHTGMGPHTRMVFFTPYAYSNENLIVETYSHEILILDSWHPISVKKQRVLFSQRNRNFKRTTILLKLWCVWSCK